MESISKTPVSRHMAEAMLAAALGPGARLSGIEELTEGYFNAAYTLTLADGRRLVVKVAPPPEVEVLTYEIGIIGAEVAALRLIRDRTNVPVPEVLWFDDSCRLVASPWLLMSHQPGVSLHLHRAEIAPEARRSIDAQLGSHLRAVNGLTAPHFGLMSPVASRHATWVAAFGELFESVLRNGERRSVALPIEYAHARRALAAAGPALAEVTEPRLVHWDLWDGNVLVDPDTNEVTGVLDLERSMWGDPLMEFQFAMPPVSPAFADAYGSSGPTTAPERLRRAVYTLHWHLVMSIEGTYRQYPEDPIGEWARGRLAGDVELVLAG